MTIDTLNNGMSSPTPPPPPARWPSVIAIDGPAASGKSTIGHTIADRLGYLYFDSGLLYRALTWLALRDGIDVDDGDALAALAERSNIEVSPPMRDDGRQYTVEVDGVDITWDLRRPEVDANVSVVARHPAVRAALMDQQRRIADKGGVVMVGRDIGTVVLPDAPLKVFLVASLVVRARRRYEELLARDQPADFDSILADMRRRDEIDSGRAVAPLKAAPDAIQLDTTKLSVAEVVAHVLGMAEAGPPVPEAEEWTARGE